MQPRLHDPLSETLSLWRTDDLRALRATVLRWLDGDERERMEHAITDEIERRKRIQ